MGNLRRHCAKVREPSELQFGVVRGVGRGIGVLDEDPRPTRGKGDFGGLRFPVFTIGKFNGVAASACCLVNS